MENKMPLFSISFLKESNIRKKDSIGIKNEKDITNNICNKFETNESENKNII